MVKTSSFTTSLIKRQATPMNVADERTTLVERYVSSAHYMLTASLAVKLTRATGGLPLSILL